MPSAARGTVLALLVLAAFLPSCSPSGSTMELLVVMGPSSLQDVLVSTAGAFEKDHPGVRVEFTFTTSAMMLSQIKEGSTCDVVLSGDPETVERLRPDLDPASITPFLSNALALVGRAGLATRLSSPRDLIGQTGKIVLVAPEVPSGRQARAYLERAGLLGALGGRIVDAENVLTAITIVDGGNVDWALLCKTDALLAKRSTLLWVASSADDPGITYVGSVVARSTARSARAYVSWLKSAAFQAAAEKQGFRAAR